MRTFGSVAVTLAALGVSLLSGCFSHEWSHELESRAIGLETVQLPHEGDVDALSLDNSTVYIRVLAVHALSSKCVGGILLVPLDVRMRGEEELNSPAGRYNRPLPTTSVVKVGITPGPQGFDMEFGKITLEYLGKAYRPARVFAGARRVTDKEVLAPGNETVWYNLTFPVHIDAKDQFSILLDGYTVSGQARAVQVIEFGPKDVHRVAEYGERGC
ncbi:hypothetical protein [Paraburkholderia phenoliruptrix]|uniref:Lipoprotein n=1 Tax=Paraburkholderia phenoliruptrix TaxID=252970 RepID=A0A6J5K8I6_9BURK|nr:hypothetical protein [Paraburkholderia phenoliruptrix]CAB4050409.1 hypothetical protein LMG9964_04075 [Paraburkholderia phenoliruptrix]